MTPAIMTTQKRDHAVEHMETLLRAANYLSVSKDFFRSNIAMELVRAAIDDIRTLDSEVASDE